jgi:hypothetical protein
MGSAWGQTGVHLGSAWGQPGVSLGSTWGQPGVNLGSACKALPRIDSEIDALLEAAHGMLLLIRLPAPGVIQQHP